jgi:hypothetical protein
MIGLGYAPAIAFIAVGAGFIVGLLVQYITKSDGQLAVASGFVTMIIMSWLVYRWFKFKKTS